MKPQHNIGRPVGSAQGEKNTGAKLTADQVREIRELYADGGETYVSLADRFDVSPTTVGRIVTRELWPHVQ